MQCLFSEHMLHSGIPPFLVAISMSYEVLLVAELEACQRRAILDRNTVNFSVFPASFVSDVTITVSA